MRRVYLALAIVGAIVPYIFFIQHFSVAGLDPYAMLSGMFANPMASGLTSDLLISSGVFWVWMFRNRGPKPWIFMALNLAIGLSCALPAYLYVRETREG